MCQPDTLIHPLSPAGAFAVNMGTFMQERGLTAAAVARRFGHSQSAIYQYTSGRAMPRPSLRPDLAAALGIPLAQLESWTKGKLVSHTESAKPRTTLDDALAEVRGVLRKMPAERLPVVVEIVRQMGRL